MILGVCLFCVACSLGWFLLAVVRERRRERREKLDRLAKIVADNGPRFESMGIGIKLLPHQQRLLEDMSRPTLPGARIVLFPLTERRPPSPAAPKYDDDTEDT